MCITASALASVRRLHSLSHSPFAPAGLSSPLYTTTRSISAFSSVWDVYNLSRKVRKARKGGPLTLLDKHTAVPQGKGFSNIYLARAMSNVLDFDTPIDRQRFHAQFITTPTADTPGTTLLLHFNSKRYLFGRVAEGTQRACIERGVALKKARNIFLTGETKWAHNSGLLGMILTMADFQVETNEEEQAAMGKIRIHGGPKLWHSIACARRFIFRTGMPLKVFEADPNTWEPSSQPDFVDENLMLWALPVQRTPRRDTSPAAPHDRSTDQKTLDHEQGLRRKTVHDMFDSDWRKDKLYEAVFQEVNLPAMVWVRDPETKALQATFCTKLSDAPHIKPDQKVLVRMPWPAALVAELPPADNLPSSISMCYIVKGRPQRGSFIPQKAKALGVKPGPMFGQLANRQTVTLEDGRTITPEEVMDPITPGQGVALLDIQDVEYLSDLLRKLQSMGHGQLSHVHAFIWILGPGVFDSSEFSDFQSNFPDVQHVVASADNNSNYITMSASAASATRLNQIRPEMFPIPKHDNTIVGPVESKGKPMRAQRGLTLDLAPIFKIDTKEVPDDLDIQATAEAMSAETRALIPTNNEPQSATEEQYKDVSVITLGTGSAMPSKYRNVSANLLHIPSLGYFILDAGENSLGQLKRMYNADELDEILCNLHMIWISHLHADHHLGTVSLLVAHKHALLKRKQAGNPVAHNLYLVSERNMADYLEDYKSVEASDAIMLHCLNSKLTDVDGKDVDVQTTTMPVSKLDTTRVSHCHGAQALSITFSNGFKISYSGDCRPSASFADIGRDSDILIHEATFDDGMEGDAMAKKHCTIGEALGVASAMRAKNVILTHFSQRYQKLPTLTDVPFPGQVRFEEGDDANDPAGPIEDAPVNTQTNSTIAKGPSQTSQPPSTNTFTPPTLTKQTSLQEAARKMSICVAFDLMRVTIPQIKDMYKYYPAIEHMFEIEQQKSDAKREAQRLANEAILQAKDERSFAKRKAKDEKKADKSKGKDKDKKNGTNVSGASTPLQALVEE